jgi:hypothetical protein
MFYSPVAANRAGSLSSFPLFIPKSKPFVPRFSGLLPKNIFSLCLNRQLIHATLKQHFGKLPFVPAKNPSPDGKRVVKQSPNLELA